MMKVAMFISGRLTCYEENLVHVLCGLSKYDVSLFASINGEPDDFYDRAEEQLAPWLKAIRYEKFFMPDDFVRNTHVETLRRMVDGDPYTVMSCFYNDMMAFELIEDYEKENGETFDVYVKFRSDMSMIDRIDFALPAADDLRIYSCIPPCQIYFFGDRSTPMCVCDAFAYGNKPSMKRYVATYEFINSINSHLSGNYRINYEPCLTESVHKTLFDPAYSSASPGVRVIKNRSEIGLGMLSSGVKIDYFACRYKHDPMRRERDRQYSPERRV